MKSVMTHRFSEVPNVEIPRSTFDRSHGLKTTFDAGYLIPILIDEVLPGDTFKLNMAGFGRLSTPTFPILDNMVLDTFFFFVPNRLVWSNWQKFCGEQVDPGDSIDYNIPKVTLTNVSNGTLWDYMGIPTLVTPGFNVSALPHRCYSRIWNEWFRDENLQDSVTSNKGDGPDTPGDYVLLKRGKRHDYFTSCLPFLQKGDALDIPLSGAAPIMALNMEFDGGDETDNHVNIYDDLYPTGALKKLRVGTSMIFGGTNASGTGALYADMAGASLGTINELRQSIQLQRLLERDARAGTRYTEIVKSLFGVTSDDARMQRPEYLGGGSTPINVNPVPRTDSSPGELGAYGTFAFNGHGFVSSFTEHGHIIGLACVRADLTYQEGQEKLWHRDTRYDFYWPTLAHLGEQAVLNKEIFSDGSSNDGGVFGYQERFAEYRYKNSRVTGQMRSNDAASLDPWHLGIEFGSVPTLDATFIQENPPIDRCIVTPAEPHFLMDSYFQMQCTRPMPIYSIPGLIDHF